MGCESGYNSIILNSKRRYREPPERRRCPKLADCAAGLRIGNFTLPAPTRRDRKAVDSSTPCAEVQIIAQLPTKNN
jgi:hypothetical protein